MLASSRIVSLLREKSAWGIKNTELKCWNKAILYKVQDTHAYYMLYKTLINVSLKRQWFTSGFDMKYFYDSVIL